MTSFIYIYIIILQTIYCKSSKKNLHNIHKLTIISFDFYVLFAII